MLRRDSYPSLQVVALTTEAAILDFVYAGEVGLSEDQVKQAVEASLQADGWSVTTRWGQSPGIDIEARRGRERLVLEAKVEGSRPQMRGNFFLHALGELLQRMDGPDANFGLALPAHRRFAGLVLKLPAWVKARLNLRFYLVRRASDGGFEVGVIETHDDGRLR